MDIETLRIGCSGWSYKDWAGVFYPKGLPAKDYLTQYSKVFNCVEIDSSFYRIPNAYMITQWKNNTPAGFLFSPKVPKKITHDHKLQNSESTLVYFYSMVSKLKEKLGPIAIQLPPSFKASVHFTILKDFISQLSPEFKHAIEFRHKSWFTPETYALLKKNNIAMVWSLNQYLETPPEVTADFMYLRLVGDRKITEFNRVQNDRSDDYGEALQLRVLTGFCRDVEGVEVNVKDRPSFPLHFSATSRRASAVAAPVPSSRVPSCRAAGGTRWRILG